METAPKNTEMTPEQIDAEIAQIDKRIIAIESQPLPHFESGSNSEQGDQSQENEMDAQAMGIGPEFEIGKLRHRRAELEELKHKAA